MVELDVKRFQIQVLFTPQISHRKVTDIFHVVHVTAGGETAVVSHHGFLGQKVLRNVGDVFAVVSVLRPLRVAGFET